MSDSIRRKMEEPTLENVKNNLGEAANGMSTGPEDIHREGEFETATRIDARKGYGDRPPHGRQPPRDIQHRQYLMDIIRHMQIDALQLLQFLTEQSDKLIVPHNAANR